MCEIKDEKLQSVVTGEYQCERGRVRGVYTTCDDAYAVININVLERLLNNAHVDVTSSQKELNTEELYKQFGKVFYERYSQELTATREQEIYETRCANARKNANARKKNAKEERFLIIREILLGKSLKDIMSENNFSKSKVYSVLQGYCGKTKKYDLFADYSRNPRSFDDVTREQIQELLDNKGSFKALNQLRAEKAQAAAEAKAESDAKAEAYLADIEKRYAEYLQKDGEEPAQPAVKITDEVTVDNVMAILGNQGVESKPTAHKEESEEIPFIPTEVDTKKAIADDIESRIYASAMAKREQKARVKSATPTLPLQEESKEDSACEIEENAVVEDENREFDDWGDYVD